VATLMLASRNAPIRTGRASTSLSLRTWLREGWTIRWADILRAKQAADASARSPFVTDARERPFYSARRHKHWHPGVACSPTLHASAG
jgi:hypothetical protein